MKTTFDRRKGFGRRRLDSLTAIGKTIISQLDFKSLLKVIANQSNMLLSAERCSIFLIDDKCEYLTVYVSQDLKNSFKLPKEHGIVGSVFLSRETLIVNDAYQDPRFSSKADQITGFHTKNIICTPLLGNNGNCLGTLQLINKLSGGFLPEDKDIIQFLASFVSIAIENSLLFEEMKNSERAKRKAISHLSHEMLTPLAIISAAFDQISRTAKSSNFEHVDKPAIRGKKNADRLIQLQYKIRNIIDQQIVDVEQSYTNLLTNIEYFIQEYDEDLIETNKKFKMILTKRIHEILYVPDPELEPINLNIFLKQNIKDIFTKNFSRYLNIDSTFEEKCTILMDKKILKSIFTSLLKNAIENTPDEGLISISAKQKENHIYLKVKDYGVGITKNNKKHVFSGLFHTQKTEDYSSKKAYEFNAGGYGIDLLRIKVLSEKYEFLIDFISNRCGFIPKDDQICPGRIALCNHVSAAEECYESGGSEFTIKFPILA